jgi:FAD/FMN-containing dehydrogenase
MTKKEEKQKPVPTHKPALDPKNILNPGRIFTM